MGIEGGHGNLKLNTFSKQPNGLWGDLSCEEQNKKSKTITKISFCKPWIFCKQHVLFPSTVRVTCILFENTSSDISIIC